MSTFVFKLIGFLIVVGVIFFAGVIVGGGFATEASQDTQRDRIEQCLPLKTAEELSACVEESQ